MTDPPLPGDVWATELTRTLVTGVDVRLFLSGGHVLAGEVAYRGPDYVVLIEDPEDPYPLVVKLDAIQAACPW